MKKYIIILFAFIGSFAYTQELDFQQLCLDCVEQNGFYCGDDPANWTQYAPNGCVPNGAGGLEYLNDGWEDCVDGSDENGAVPTPVEACGPIGPPPCDTVYVDVIQYETIYETIFDTIVEYETIFDTIIQTEYVYEVDTIIEIQYEYITEYIDCDTGAPCNTSIMEMIDKSKQNGVIYNINGQAIREREGLYIENGKIYYKTK